MTKKLNEQTFYIPVGMKKYPLIIKETWEIDSDNGEIVHITCKIINLNQNYLKEDLPLLFMDIQRMIEQELSQKANAHLHIRLKNSEKLLIEQKAYNLWYSSISDFVKAKVFT